MDHSRGDRDCIYSAVFGHQRASAPEVYGDSDGRGRRCILEWWRIRMWEMAFCTVVAICAYNGLRSYRFIGIGWLLHTAWDILHHLYGHPIIPFLPTSSFGCAVCDPVIALWCFAGAPSFSMLFGRRTLAEPRP